MPNYDLRGIRAAQYQNDAGVVSYDAPISVGDAMQCNLELRFAEGRLYAESTLAEFMKLATGGTISLGVKYIPQAAQKMMFDTKDRVRTVGSAEVTSSRFTAKDIGRYVGMSFYSPDKVDGEDKYTCVFVKRALFGPPSMTYQTRGENLTFQTPTITGEFLADHTADQDLLEIAIVDSEADAIAWCAAVFADGEDIG